MNRRDLLDHLPTFAIGTVAVILACSVAAPAINAAGGGMGGTPAREDQVPAGADYSAAECTDISSAVSCGGLYVLACCTESSCGYVVTDGNSLWAVSCASTSDCDAAADDLLDYCDQGSGDSGYGDDMDTGYPDPAERRRRVAHARRP